MDTRERIVMSWSGGKDSAMALHEIRRSDRYEVVTLITSIAKEYERISHHGVRETLLEAQADAIGLPLHKIYLPSGSSHPCTNSVYEDIMEEVMLKFRDAGIRTVAFGDIFLEDLRAYRERNLAKVDMQALFPIWKRETSELATTFIESEFRAYLSCVEGRLGRSFAGRAFDADLLRDLPEDVDPCGEYGEFHSFVYDGPIFKQCVDVAVGRVVERQTRFYADLLPADARNLEAEPIEIPAV